mgnify:CR=1 FL=1
MLQRSGSSATAPCAQPSHTACHPPTHLRNGHRRVLAAEVAGGDLWRVIRQHACRIRLTAKLPQQGLCRRRQLRRQPSALSHAAPEGLVRQRCPQELQAARRRRLLRRRQQAAGGQRECVPLQ